MLNFQDISVDNFLKNYWQKKPLIIRNALLHFDNPLTADELAGLAMEEEVESRLVIESPADTPCWSLKRGPFVETDFENLPATNWTLLVQGVDRFIPEVADLFDHFNFLPQWRVDDVMISYAVEHGGVGPHYDHYDVFLYQAKGRRKWALTTKNCDESNYQQGAPLKIMKVFNTEEEFILEEGDMLYLPPHVAHHGISLSKDCMTYSFGFRSYQSQELWDSFGEYLAAKESIKSLYKDPIWTPTSGTVELPKEAWLQAKKSMQALLDNELLLKEWFGTFATSLDGHAESILPMVSVDDECINIIDFKSELLNSQGLIRNPVCRFAYLSQDEAPFIVLYVNACVWNSDDVAIELVKMIANQRKLQLDELLPFLKEKANYSCLYELWKLQWLEFL